MKEDLRQIRMDSLAAKYLHKKSISFYEKIKIVFLVSTIVTPIVFIVASYVSKGTNIEPLINTISFALSIILISLSVIMLIIKLDDKILIHKIGLKNNIYIARESESLLSSQTNKSALIWFFRYISEIDTADHDTFSGISEEKTKKAYRESLKEFTPGDSNVKCPKCNSSPWEYKKGNCQMCGNTPTEN